ncbi:hypothetical protein OJ997_24590 [Solirubrobacter phytolaccae]|uniref:Uncharacterized protein n=1 Tax=Solirubrobacter phytolaccae TaxID=1404360 RepID=A0A9X3NEL8_9ACTN|nr:hypothetical protein [Solirubrobacter phytolaccae]MDA0183510.1 hypothetical protein [Solirubrobacter phytolaccae]
MSTPEDEVEELQKRSNELGEEIADAREDWERKQADDAVPGAVGTPKSERGLPEPDPTETD